MSPTDNLVRDIELLTCSSWTPFVRQEVGDLIRKYRFNQIGEAIKDASKLTKDTDMSSQLGLNKEKQG